LVLAKILLSLGQQIGDSWSSVNTPGRFDKVIYLDLPAKRKRFELFKFYYKWRINWDYFAKQTVGWCSISAAMNSSLLKVISNFSDYWSQQRKNLEPIHFSLYR
jgi:hypothetical protein